MKTHRSILMISLVASIISFMSILFFKSNTKIFQIMLALMGSSFISFLLEIPNYYSLQQENLNKLYYSLFDLKFRLSLFKNMIERYLNENSIIGEKFYEQNLQSIINNIDTLRNIDKNLYFHKKKNLFNMNVLSSLENAYYNLNQECLKYTTNYIQYQIQNQVFVNLNSSELSQQLNLILNDISSFTNIIEKEAPLILPNDLSKKWIIDDSIIVNTNNNIK